MALQSVDLKSLKKKLLTRLILFPVLLGSILLLSAGTFDYWEVYAYLGVIILPLTAVVTYFLKHDPEFLERRMKLKEKESSQKKIVSYSAIGYIIGFLLPGFDHRYGWSDIPVDGVIAADIIVLLCYFFIMYVFMENRYASRVIEVEKQQTVISSGPYGYVRHPMYLGSIMMFLATPISLGSYWALIPFATVPVSMVFRILNEEKVLREQLDGYHEYCVKVRYRLLPYLW
ncbi:MAG: isoprenylcysteine carboxylmethyltransferase family protein [Bacteroidota bacterium]